ncbi:MAG TPA: hypothetical protein VL728_07905 [Cyclobacteriaceae bacterium]|jgi:hypothetical protein|nr:hypothetical protein [Cyclobacteriaceae bacterium]
MKKHFAIVFCILIAGSALCQIIAPAPSDKSVVYFVRTSSLGFAINFSYFDSTKLIGRFNGRKYTRYECNPGKHLLWARSENRDFMEADLEPGKIYILKANPTMGFNKAQVSLEQVDPNNPNAMKNILKLLAKRPSEQFTEAMLAEDTKDLLNVIERGMAKYAKDKASGAKIRQLNQSLFYKAP